jgi:hypothetical protein
MIQEIIQEIIQLFRNLPLPQGEILAIAATMKFLRAA